MGEANQRGTYEERRNARLNEMVESAEVILALRVDDDGKLVLSSLARDNPVDASSPAIGFAEFLLANWKDLAGQALALKTTALAAGDREDVRQGLIELPGSRAANEGNPVILDARGGVISSSDDGPRVELPASAAQREEEA